MGLAGGDPSAGNLSLLPDAPEEIEPEKDDALASSFYRDSSEDLPSAVSLRPVNNWNFWLAPLLGPRLLGTLLAAIVEVRYTALVGGAFYEKCPAGDDTSKSLFNRFNLKAFPPRVAIFLSEFDDFDDLLGQLKDYIRLG